MKNATTIINELGQEITIEILISFSIEEYNKNYVAYTINDDGISENVQICISEIIYSEDGLPSLVSIPEEEKELVLIFYNNIKESI